MNPALLDILTDPDTDEALVLDDGALVAPSGTRYDIRGGIPRLSDPAGSGQADTFDSFSWKWSHVTREEIDQRFEQQYAWYDERYGFAGDGGLAEFLGDRSRILEAGTGLGGDAVRFARLAPHAQVVAIDLSSGIETAVGDLFARYGIAPTLTTLLGAIVVAVWGKAVLMLLAKRQVGYTVARVATE